MRVNPTIVWRCFPIEFFSIGDFRNVFKFHAYSVNKRLFLTSKLVRICSMYAKWIPPIEITLKEAGEWNGWSLGLGRRINLNTYESPLFCLRVHLPWEWLDTPNVIQKVELSMLDLIFTRAIYTTLLTSRH